MKNRLLQITATLLLFTPFAALATPGAQANDPGTATGRLNVEVSLDQVWVDQSAANASPKLARFKKCTNISNCQIFTPWAKNPYINRIYLAQIINQRLAEFTAT